MALTQTSPLTVHLSDCTNVQIGANNDQIHVISNTQSVGGLQDQLNCLKREMEQQEIDNNIRQDEQKQQFEVQLSIMEKKYRQLEAKSNEQVYRQNEMMSVLEEMNQRDHVKTTQIEELQLQVDNNMKNIQRSKTRTETITRNTNNLDMLPHWKPRDTRLSSRRQKLPKCFPIALMVEHNNENDMNM